MNTPKICFFCDGHWWGANTPGELANVRRSLLDREYDYLELINKLEKIKKKTKNEKSAEKKELEDEILDY
jgi:hypothetical protein